MTNISEKPAYISREEKNGITQDFIKQLFEYRDGCLYRIKRTSNKSQIGERIGSFDTDKDGYERCRTEINHRSYNISRLVFLFHHGYLPVQIDHIDRNPLNNKIENLRVATPSENAKNRASAKGSSSQYLGVHWHSQTRKNYKYERWMVRIKANELHIYGGSFKLEDENEAALTYNKLAVKHHGEFANLNIIKPK